MNPTHFFLFIFHKMLSFGRRLIQSTTQAKVQYVSLRNQRCFSATPLPPKIFQDAKDYVTLLGTDYVEFYCSNAKQAAHWYQSALGFEPLAYRGLETGNTQKTSYVLRQNKITLVLTSPLKPDTEIGKHVDKHGDGVKVIALKTTDAVQAFEETTKRGAKAYLEPTVLSDNNGKVTVSGIHTYGDTVHIFVDRTAYTGKFMPEFINWERQLKTPDVGLKFIDHMVGNVDWGQMDHWCDYYKTVFGFQQLISFDDKDISTEFTALKSKVMTSGNGYVKFPINEPAHGKKKSQIEEYINFYQGAGCQHIAVATDDIIKTVKKLQSLGVEFLFVPSTYYDTVIQRVGQIEEPLEVLKNLGILVDRDENGYMLQIFTKPMGDRPTLFFEIIQRKGAHSFGKGNFKALFESIEEEQRKRGTL